MYRWYTSCIALLLLAGCYTATAPRAERERQAPPYAQESEHYLDFESADDLAAYLRYDSEAGPLVSAHRGGSYPAFPENAIETFERTLRVAPALLEVDVRMSRDSVLVLLHDDTLDRTTTGRGALSDLPMNQIRALLLRDVRGIATPFRIPTLDEALSWAEGRAVLQLDVKQGVPPERVVDAIRRLRAEDQALVITYTLENLLRYHELAPDLMLSASAESVDDVNRLIETGIDLSRLIAFTGVGEVKPEVVERLHEHGIRAILGTFGEIDRRAQAAGYEVYHALLDRGVDILATDNPPLAARAIATTRAY